MRGNKLAINQWVRYIDPITEADGELYGTAVLHWFYEYGYRGQIWCINSEKTHVRLMGTSDIWWEVAMLEPCEAPPLRTRIWRWLRLGFHGRCPRCGTRHLITEAYTMDRKYVSCLTCGKQGWIDN